MAISALQLHSSFTGCCNVFCTSTLPAFKLRSIVGVPRWSLYFPPHIACPRQRRLQKQWIVRAVSPEESVESDFPATDIQEGRPTGRKRGKTVSGSKRTSPKSASTRRRKKNEENLKPEVADTVSDGEIDKVIEYQDENKDENQHLEDDDQNDDDDGAEYDWPPLVCCFGAAQNKFISIAAREKSPHVYRTAEGLHWNPSDFVRARGGPPSNVAIALVQLGGRAALMGKVGNDRFGRQMLLTLNINRVQTRGIRVDPSVSTAVSHMRLTYQEGKLQMTCIKPCAEDSLLSSEINVDILKEARMFYFNSMVLLRQSMRSTLLTAIKMSKKYGGVIFFDVNLPLPLWRSCDETRRIIEDAWNGANVIEVSKQELRFLLDEDSFKKKRNLKPQYDAEFVTETKEQEDYHFTREEISPLWHDNIKILFVNDGINLHYYTPTFDGSVQGAETRFLTPFTCDRSASGDAVVADIMRILTMEPELYNHQVHLEKALRYAITSGIAAQWETSRKKRYAPESEEAEGESLDIPLMWQSFKKINQPLPTLQWTEHYCNRFHPSSAICYYIHSKHIPYLCHKGKSHATGREGKFVP